MTALHYLNKSCLATLAALLLPISAWAAQQGNSLSLASATKALETVARTSTGQIDKVAISIVDSGGHLIYFARAETVPSGMGEAAVKKAQTAAAYGLSTKMLEDAVSHGNTSYLSLPGILPLRGGLPVVINGSIVGAIGVAGSDSDSDAALAQTILSALPY